MTEQELEDLIRAFLWVKPEPLEGEEHLPRLDTWAVEEPAPVYCL